MSLSMCLPSSATVQSLNKLYLFERGILVSMIATKHKEMKYTCTKHKSFQS